MLTDENMVLPLAGALKTSASQIRNATVITHNNGAVIQYNDKRIKQNGHTVSEGFFDVFTFRFLKGDPGFLTNSSSIALTESAAKALFGDADPINKIVRIQDDRNATVAAILADPPANSSLTFEFIAPFNYSEPFI